MYVELSSCLVASQYGYDLCAGEHLHGSVHVSNCRAEYTVKVLVMHFLSIMLLTTKTQFAKSIT
jgi:hypothetical protein